MFVNGVRVQSTIVVTEGAVIKIGPFTLIRRGDNLEVLDPGNEIRLDAYRLYRIVRDQRGKTQVLLNDISLAIEPGQFVALVGGSGTGKSTLMRTLLGIDPTTKGQVYINGEDLRNNFNIYRTQIGYVPQFFADSFFVKKPERVETILFIMSLCLLVYNLGQRELRKT